MPYVNKIRTGGETYTINALPNQDTQDGKFLSTDGLESYWAELPIMEGASSEEEGSGGLVPAPNAGDEDKYLAGDATWKTVIDSVPDMTAPSDGEAGVHGLVPAPGINDGSKYLRGNGTWGEINEMVGAQDDADGSHGLVPAPTAGSQEKYLAGDATWKQLPALAVGTSGMVSGPTEEDSEKFLSGNASWTSFDDDFDTNFSSSTPLINGKASLAIKN